MSRLQSLVSVLLILAALCVCNGLPYKTPPKTLLLIPIGVIDTHTANRSYALLNQKIANIYLAPAIKFPPTAYVAARNRYRADTCLKYLTKKYGKDTVAIGLTSQDLSTTKNNIADWGIMGLGQRPGNACIISTYRLKTKNKQEQATKVLLHEIGHTQNLKHCPTKTCLMRDAEGGNPLDDETDFCPKCYKHLQKAGIIKKP